MYKYAQVVYHVYDFKIGFHMPVAVDIVSMTGINGFPIPTTQSCCDVTQSDFYPIVPNVDSIIAIPPLF